jgi:RNA polymerase sigma factor FliA
VTPPPPAGEPVELRINDALWILDKVARKLSRSRRVEHDELVSVGYIALRRAAESFDASLGVPFGRYAWYRVSWAMNDEVRRRAQQDSRVADAGLQAVTLLADRGDVLRDDEARHRITAREYLDAVAAAMRARVLSHHSYSVAAGGWADDAMPDLERARRVLDEALAMLPPEEARIVEQHYLGSTTLRSVAEQLGVSYRTAQRRHNDALRSLAAALRACLAA